MSRLMRQYSPPEQSPVGMRTCWRHGLEDSRMNGYGNRRGYGRMLRESNKKSAATVDMITESKIVATDLERNRRMVVDDGTVT